MRKRNKNSGQVMLLSVLIIGSSTLVFTSVAGYLMIQRLRASTNVVDSTKAIFAADAGIECELYNRFAGSKSLINCSDNKTAEMRFEDKFISLSTAVLKDGSGVPQSIKSIGTSNNSKRAFLAGFPRATSTLP